MSYQMMGPLLGRRRSNDIPFPDVSPESVVLHLGRNTSNYTGANIQWNEELVDTYGAFAPTSDTVTIPAAMNGKLVRLVGNQNLTQDHGTNYPAGTAAKPGWPIRGINNGATFGAQIHNWASGPFTPATGQTIFVRNYYESAGSLLNATLLNYSRNFLVMEELDANTARCVAYKTAPQSIPADTTTPVVFEALTENNTGEFALAPGGTGVIIPRSGYYRLFCNIATDTAVGTSQTVEAVTLIDGVTHTGGVDQTRTNKAYHGEGGVSAGVYIAKGQVVSLSAYHNDAGTANLQGAIQCFLSIEQLPAGMKRTIATTDGTQSIATAGTDTNIQYKGAHLFSNCGTEIHNPAGADPTAFVCPAGCNRGRVTMNWFDDTNRQWQLQVGLGTDRTKPIANHSRAFSTVHAVNMFSPAFTIAPGQIVRATGQFVGVAPVTIPAPNSRKAMWLEACFWAA